MCTTIALMGASLAMAAVGTTVSAVGAAKQSDYQEKQALQSANLAKARADDAKARGRSEETRLRMNVIRMAGQAEAQWAASGATGDSPTGESLLEDIYYGGEMDAQIIRENAAREAWGHMAQAGILEGQADLYSQAGSYNVGTSLLSGATSMADQWYRYKRPYQPAAERYGVGSRD